MRNEKGALVIEATISLTTFVFLIFTLLNIVNICFIQAKIATALNTAAKQISQYTYLYYATGIDELDGAVSSGTEEQTELSRNTITGVGQIMDSLGGAKDSASAGDFNTMMDKLEEGKASADSLVDQYGEAIGDDPGGFIMGMGKMAVSESKEFLKNQVFAKAIAKSFMAKNLMSQPGDDPDAFLRGYKVKDGLDGLNFMGTSLMAYGKTNEMQLVCTYDVQVIKFLNIDVSFTISQCSKTKAWGKGVTLLGAG